MKTTEPFIETPQGIFIQHAGWLRITSDFLDKSYAELWEIRDKSAVFVEINDWALAFGSFPAFWWFMATRVDQVSRKIKPGLSRRLVS